MSQRFADTFFFIAYLSENDAAHDRALELSVLGGDRVVTSRWVLMEVADGFAATPFREAAAELIRELLTHPTVEVAPATDEWMNRGLELYRNRPDKAWSHTDCISFIIMGDFGLTEALTADHHFEQAGFVALLKERS